MRPSEVQQEIKAILGVASSIFEEKFLGIPTPEGNEEWSVPTNP
jgi:hypothetical protein